jgi:hypothetical protein
MTRSVFDPNVGQTERGGTRFTPPAVPTVQIAKENDGKLLVVKLTGKLQKSDYLHFVPMVNEAVARDGKIRVLVELHDFHGWSAGAIWEDIKFDLKNFNQIERLAIVGETRWEHGMAAFCWAFTSAKIQYFTHDQAREARKWILETD